MIVCKFGGTSVASAEQIQKVANIVKSNPARKIVAVSAPGKRSGDDMKVTDLLINLAMAALKNEDVEGLANAMKNMMDNYSKYDREAISNDATRKFSYEVIAEKYLQVYKQLIEKNSK